MAGLVATLLSACSAAGAPNLDGRDFLSTGVTDGGAARPLVPGTRIRLGFGAKDLNASAGCNSMGGSYRIEGGRLLFEGGGMTDMGCDAPRHAQDEWLSTFLGSKPAVVLAGNDLTLAAGSTIIRLLDREVADPDLTLVGPTWTVETIVDGDAAMSVPAGETASLAFKADGTVDVDAGCNRGSGTWRLEGTGLAITALAMTKIACAGAAGRLEDAVLGVLREESLTAQIEASVLTLSSAAGGLQLRGS
jgi:heat shock protein HslJ